MLMREEVELVQSAAEEVKAHATTLAAQIQAMRTARTWPDIAAHAAVVQGTIERVRAALERLRRDAASLPEWSCGPVDDVVAHGLAGMAEYERSIAAILARRPRPRGATRRRRTARVQR